MFEVSPHRGPTEEHLTYATKRAIDALEHDHLVEWAHRYYDPENNYAGRTFVSTQPNDPFQITATDLYAVSLLNVTIGPYAGRRLLAHEALRYDIHESLAAVPPETDLAEASDSMLRRAESAHVAIKHALGGSNRWVTASKLCARKRPKLFPVRDRLVTVTLLRGGRDRWVDWKIYQSLIRNAQITQRLKSVIASARAHGDKAVAIDDPLLRTLDVALWTYTKYGLNQPATRNG